MDPHATLIDAIDALRDLRFNDAKQLLLDYDRWRSSGGFEPQIKGDTIRDEIRKALAYWRPDRPKG